MKNSIFITTNLSKNTGGGNVSYHELNSLSRTTDIKLALANKETNEYSIPIKSILPTDHKLPNNEFLWDYLACEKVDPIIREHDIDIIFINGNPFGKTVDHIINYHIAHNRKKPKIIVSVPAHDLEESIREHDKLYDKKYHEVYPHMTDPFLWNMQTDHIKKADTIICPSKYSVEALRKLDLIKSQDIRIIPHGVDLPSQENVRPITYEFRVGYLGSYGSDKGVRYLVESWSSLGYNDDSTLIFGGAHSTELGSFINRFATTGKFHLMGYVKDISDFYNLCSIYVQPSITEGFGIEVLEALSYGCPVICSEGAGASSVIEDGKNGFVIKKRDPKAIADKIQYFKDNPGEIERMGKNATEKVSQFKWNIIEKRYGELYE